MYKKFLSVLGVTLLLLTVAINTTNVYADEPVYFWTAQGVNCNGYTISASGAEKNFQSFEAKKDGKWYWEETINSFAGRFKFGVVTFNAGSPTGEIIYYICEGNQFRRWLNGDAVLSTVNIGLKKGDVLGFALDADNNSVQFFKNGVSIYKLNNAFTSFVKGENKFSAYGGTGDSSASSYNVTYNFGQSDFKYAIPAGYKPFMETPVAGVAVSPQSHIMDVGETFALDAQVVPTDATKRLSGQAMIIPSPLLIQTES